MTGNPPYKLLSPFWGLRYKVTERECRAVVLALFFEHQPHHTTSKFQFSALASSWDRIDIGVMVLV